MKWKIPLFVFLCLLVFSPFVIIKLKKETKKEVKNKYKIVEGGVSEGDVIIDILKENGVPSRIAYPVANELSKIFNVKKVNIGDKYKIYFNSEDGNFKKFVYYNGPLNIYKVEYDQENKKFFTTGEKVKVEKEIIGAKGEINSSLYESMRNHNVNPEIIIQFAEIFASKIDFFTDCRKGDKFTVLWESYKDENGNILKDVKVVAGKYQNSHYTYYAFYFKPENGKGSYYDENGKSVESAFLKAPLNYRRISSYFSYRRFHPILRKYRPHLGIDYAAPTGTPVSAIGDGVVLFAGWSTNGYGNYVKIKHPNGYVSYYGHLSKIRRGIRKGIRVRKGQVIGYVGMTGLATGPHLDFRIKKNGKFVNFLKLKLPPSYPLDKKYLPEFEKVKQKYLARMTSL